MRIAILTGLPSFEPYYSVARCVRDQVAMLEAAGHDVRLYVKVGFNPSFGALPCIAPVKTPGFMNVEGRTTESIAKEFDLAFGQGELNDYDAVFTHDFMFLPSLIGYREGVRLVAPKTKAKWFHWSHSVPRLLRPGAEAIPGHIYISLIQEHVPGIMEMYKASADMVEVVWNPSDVLDTMDGEARGLAMDLELLDTDILGVLPFSIGRIDQKGIDVAIQIYAELSKTWRVKVLLCNSLSGDDSGRKKVDLWDKKLKDLIDKVGPRKDAFSWWWMSRAVPEFGKWTPNETIRDLQRISNLFIYPTIGEGFSLAIGEALASGGPLCVLPKRAVKGMEELEKLGGVLLVDWREKPWPAPIRPIPELTRKVADSVGPGVHRLRRQYALSRAGVWKRQLEPALKKHVQG